MKILFLMFLALMFIPSVSAYGSYSQNQLNDSSTEYNVTFNATPYSELVYISVPRNANITSAEWNFTGYNGLNFTEDLNNTNTATIGKNVNRFRGPTPFNTNAGEINDAEYEYLYFQDYNYTNYTYLASGDYYVCLRFSILFPNHGSANVSNVTVIWQGYTTSPTAYLNGELHIFNHTSSSYVEFHNWTTETNLTASNITNNDFIDSGGSVVFGVCSHKSNAATEFVTVFTDYINVTVTSTTYPENITMDVGNNGENDFINDTVFNTSEIADLNFTAINNYLHDTCTEDWDTGTCDVPFNISSVTLGLLEISSINLTGEYLNKFGVCSETYENETIYFYFYDEVSLDSSNGSVEYTIGDSESSFNNSESNLPNFTVCSLGDPTYTVDMTMIYWNESSDQRTYYFYQAEIDSDTPQNISLYMISSTPSERLELSVHDANDQPVEDAFVNIQRYYVSENIYRTITVGQTDSEGKILTYVYPDTVFHRFTISLAGIVSNTEGPMLIPDTSDDPELLTLYTVPSETEFFDIINNVAANCYVNYATNNTICIVSDGSQLVTTANLFVERAQLSGYTEICDESGSGSAFTLNCSLGTSPEGNYRYVLTVIPASGNSYVLSSDTFAYIFPGVYGDFGVFAAFFIMIVLVMTAIVAPPIALIFSVIALGVSAFMGWLEVSMVSITGLMIVVGIIIYRSR